MARIVYTHGDTAPDLRLDLTRAGRSVILDPAATVEGFLTIGATTTEVDVAIIDRDPAAVAVDWAAGDLVNATNADIEAELRLRITVGDDIETSPDPERFTIQPAVAVTPPPP